MEYTPKKDLIRLLGPPPSHPWAALIPQVLLWSFRRFCVEKLVLSEGGLEESMCDDVLELVHKYCAKGLEVVSMDWFTPENIEQVSSPLEDYMTFFRGFCKELDASVEANDDKRQDVLSEVLDESMGESITEWLKDHPSLLIFPVDVEDDDEFTEAQFSRLINSLLVFSYKAGKVETEAVEAPEEPPEEPLPQEPLPEAPEPTGLTPGQYIEQQNRIERPLGPLLWHVLAAAKAKAEAEAQAKAEAEAQTKAEAEAEAEAQVTAIRPGPPPHEIPVPEPRTVANALAHRRTIRKSKRFSREKTRKLLAHSTKKK
jgi:hypothetical protein